MSVAVTTLKSGIHVVTDTMPHLESASLGVWVNSGTLACMRNAISYWAMRVCVSGSPTWR